MLVRDEAEKSYRLCRPPSVRFFVANNRNLIYNRYALGIGAINYVVALIAQFDTILFSLRFVRNFTNSLDSQTSLKG